MTSQKRKQSADALKPYLKPEELEEYIIKHSGAKFTLGTVKSIALDGNLLDEEGNVGVYEIIAFMAMYVK